MVAGGSVTGAGVVAEAPIEFAAGWSQILNKKS